MEERKRVALITFIFVILVVFALAIYYFFIHERSIETPSDQTISKDLASISQEDEALPEESLESIGVELDKSDDLIRKLVQGLSPHKKFTEWLTTKDLVRNFVAAVDNIANGMTPRPQIVFFSPEGDFKAQKKDGLYYIDPEGFSRYDRLVDVFLTLDSERCARIYRRFRPLLREAYRDLGYPEGDFHRTLVRAIGELVEVPIIEADILLEKKVLTYVLADLELENLSEAQKHLLRMGPENVRIVQDKLRQLAKELNIPEDQLPQ